jgi:hypothetical protein
VPTLEAVTSIRSCTSGRLFLALGWWVVVAAMEGVFLAGAGPAAGGPPQVPFGTSGDSRILDIGRYAQAANPPVFRRVSARLRYDYHFVMDHVDETDTECRRHRRAENRARAVITTLRPGC